MSEARPNRFISEMSSKFDVPKSQRKLASWLISLTGGLIALFLNGEPTGTLATDYLYRFLLVVVVSQACSRSRRGAQLLSGVSMILVAQGSFVIGSIAVLTCCGVLIVGNIRSRSLGALLGVLIVFGLMLMDQQFESPFAQSLIGVAVCLPVLFSGYKRLRTRHRHSAVLVAAALVGSVGVVTAFVGVQVVRSVPSIHSATASTASGISSARNGDGAEASAHFETATDDLGRASGILSNPLVSLATLVPILAQNVRAARSAVSTGENLGEASQQIAQSVDFTKLQNANGGVNLEVLSSYREPLQSTDVILAEAQEFLDRDHSPWLLPALSSQLERVSKDVSDLQSQNRVAELGAIHGPAILGANETRRYLMLLANPAESRDMGGHIGNWAEVEIINGEPELVQVGVPRDLAKPASSISPWELADLDQRYPPSLTEMKPLQYPQNWAAHPDFDTVAELSAELFEGSTGRPVDGVIYADVEVFSALLSMTGPIAVKNERQDLQLSASTSTEFLTVEQFGAFTDTETASSALEASIETLFDKLFAMPIPSPVRVSDLFWPLVDEGRFRMQTFHPTEKPLFERFSLTGSLPRLDGTDLLGVFTRNAGPSKIDSFVRRDATAKVVVDPDTGDVAVAVGVSLFNEAPSAGYNDIVLRNGAGLPFASAVMDLSIMTPHSLEGVLLDGVSVASKPMREGNLWRYSVRITIPEGESVTVDFHLKGKVHAGHHYEMSYLRQPTANANNFELTVESSSQQKIESIKIRSGSRVDEVRSSLDPKIRWSIGE